MPSPLQIVRFRLRRQAATRLPTTHNASVPGSGVACTTVRADIGEDDRRQGVLQEQGEADWSVAATPMIRLREQPEIHRQRLGSTDAERRRQEQRATPGGPLIDDI